MAPNATVLAAKNGVDMDDLRDLPSIILYYTKGILYFLAGAIGVILSVTAVLTFIVLLVKAAVKAVTHLLNLRSKSKKAPQAASDSEGVPLQDRLGGHEESAEQTLIGKGGEASTDGDVDEGSEQLLESEQVPKYDGMSPSGRRQS